MSKTTSTTLEGPPEADDGLGAAPITAVGDAPAAPAASTHGITIEGNTDPTHASVQLTRSVDVNGNSYNAGAMLCNLPIATARNLVAQKAATIISTSRKSSTPILSNAIEDQVPSHLDRSVWCVAPGAKVVGQQASVFVLRADVAAGRFDR